MWDGTASNSCTFSVCQPAGVMSKVLAMGKKDGQLLPHLFHVIL